MKVVSIVYLTFFLPFFLPSAFAQTPEIDSLRVVIQQQTGKEQIISLQDLAFRFFFAVPDSGGVYAQQSLEQAQKSGEDSLIGEAYKYLGMHAFLTAQQDEAISYYQRAAEVHRKGGRKGSEASALANLGPAYTRKGMYDKSLEVQLQALQYFESVGDSARMLIMTTNISELYSIIEEFDKALEYSLLGLNMAQSIYGDQIPGTHFASAGRSYLSFTYQDSSFLDSALQYFRSARSAYLQRQDPVNYAVNLNNLAYTFELAGELDSAVSIYQQAFEVTRDLGQTGSATKNLANLTAGYTQLGKFDLAARWLDSAQKYVQFTDEIAPQERVFTMAYRLEKARNQPTAALKWLEAAIPLRDTILNRDKIESLNELQTLYEVEKQERLLAQQAAQLAEAKQRQQQWILGSLLGLALLSLLGALLLYRYRLRQQAALEAERLHQQQLRIRATLEAQEAEKSRFSRDLHDSVGQVLAATRLQFGAFSEQLQEARYAQALDTLDEACQEVRSIAHTLMPKALQEADLASAMQELLSKQVQPSGLSASLDVLGHPIPLTDQQAVGVYRIFQELVQNVLKHAEASQLSVQLLYRREHLVLRVEDDGKGFSPSHGGGAGLANMKLRAEVLQAELHWEAGGGQTGTISTLRVPLSSLS